MHKMKILNQKFSHLYYKGLKLVLRIKTKEKKNEKNNYI